MTAVMGLSSGDAAAAYTTVDGIGTCFPMEIFRRRAFRACVRLDWPMPPPCFSSPISDEVGLLRS